MKAYKGYRPNRVHGKGAGKNGRMCECVETATESETGCDCACVCVLVSQIEQIKMCSVENVCIKNVLCVFF